MWPLQQEWDAIKSKDRCEGSMCTHLPLTNWSVLHVNVVVIVAVVINGLES